MIKECVNCKYGMGGGSDVWCTHDPRGKESYMAPTDCEYFEWIDILKKKEYDSCINISLEFIGLELKK